MIRLLILFFLFIFLLLPTCYNIGDLLLKRLKIKFNLFLTIFVGFIATIGIFQLAFYPAMILQLPSFYLTITGTIIVICFLILDIKKTDAFKKIYTNKYIWIILFLSCIIFFIYMRTMPFDFWYFDDSFYFPFMYENASTSKLLSVEPRSGEEIIKISNIYSSQGYYMIGSYIISIYNIFKDILALKFNYMANIYYFMSFPVILMMCMSCFGMANQLSSKFKDKLLFISLYVYSIVFLALDSNLLNNILTAGYIGVFLVLNVFVPFLVFLIFYYIKGNKKYCYLISILFLTMLSCASFNIFIIFIILYSLLFILYILQKEKSINDFLLMVFPALLFLADFVIYNNILSFICQLVIIALYLLIYKFNKQILKYEKKLFDIGKYLIYVFAFVPIILSIILILTNQKINCSTIDYLKNVVDALFPLFGTQTFHYSYLVGTLFNILFLVLLLYLIIIKNKKKDFMIIYIFIIAGVFLNPLGIPFISTALTSETYNRIFVLLLNPFIYYYIFKFFINKINCKKLINLCCVIMILSCTFIQLKEFQYWVDRNGKSDKMYRLRQRDVIASSRLDSFVKEHNIKSVRIATIHSELKMLNPEIISTLNRTIVYTPNEEFTKKAYYVSALFSLNKGEIKQEYVKQYGEDMMDIFEYLNVNFVTIDIECPVLNEQNVSSNILCIKPRKDDEISEEEYLNILRDYEEDKKIYNDIIEKLELVYQTDRYKLYYVKAGE